MASCSMALNVESDLSAITRSGGKFHSYYGHLSRTLSVGVSKSVLRPGNDNRLHRHPCGIPNQPGNQFLPSILEFVRKPRQSNTKEPLCGERGNWRHIIVNSGIQTSFYGGPRHIVDLPLSKLPHPPFHTLPFPF